jgi:hypothetical protein
LVPVDVLGHVPIVVQVDVGDAVHLEPLHFGSVLMGALLLMLHDRKLLRCIRSLIKQLQRLTHAQLNIHAEGGQASIATGKLILDALLLIIADPAV